MSSRVLLALFDSTYVIALSVWVGSMLFFSLGVAPVIFGVLGEQMGGKFVRAVFPRYYLWGAIAGAIALPAFVAGPLCYHEFRGPMVGVQALVIIAGVLGMLYGGNSLTPAVNQARDAGPAGRDRFNQLHRRAVWLNALVLLAGIGLLIAFAVRRAPRTSGIVELTPAEQVRFDHGVNRLIQDVEAKYGLRPPRELKPGESAERDPLIDDDTVQEIESFYARKRARDRARARRGSTADLPADPGGMSPRLALPRSSGTDATRPPGSGQR
jgi:Domain of unknown function (DUF4149)